MASAIQVKTTGDISLGELRQLTARLEAHVAVEIDPAQGFFKSVDPPSWIKFLQEPQFWIQTLAGGVVLDLAKAGARHLWRNRSLVKSVVREGASVALGEFAETLAVVREHYGPGTALLVGVPVPNDWFCTALPLEGNDPSLYASQVALFLAHLPRIQILLDRHAAALLGQMSLSLTDDGDMVAEWVDRETMTRQREILTLPSAV